ncbi:MAG: cbb3-type cytochrome oxidase assembly protein CcoS [Verrucomicrobia bacterium]|nr:MAG: cbb3-type cytochrome oxidase assembly protein CcoS [Verrucomicrobiota bacterium]
MAMLIVLSAVYGLYWASKKGQLQDLEEGAKVIFDDEEPVGRPTDQVFHQPKSAAGKKA